MNTDRLKKMNENGTDEFDNDNLLNVSLMLLHLFMENFSITLGFLQELRLQKMYSN